MTDLVWISWDCMSLGWDDYVCFYGYIFVSMGGNLVVLLFLPFLFTSFLIILLSSLSILAFISIFL